MVWLEVANVYLARSLRSHPGMSERVNEAITASSRWSRFFPPVSANIGLVHAQAQSPRSAHQLGNVKKIAIVAVVAIEALWLGCLCWLIF
jgi:hypothetical protein